jgi:prepilin peptidase CpaA
MINPFENYVFPICLLIMTALAAGFDIRTQKIPNLLTFPAMLAALLYYTTVYGWAGLVFSFGGLIAGIALLLPAYLMGGMGAGDAKLMGAVGACIGFEETIVAFLFIAVTGCVCGLVVVIIHRKRYKGYFRQLVLTAKTIMLTRKYVPVETGTAAQARPKVYYGIAIAAGTFLYLTTQINGLQTIL